MDEHILGGVYDPKETSDGGIVFRGGRVLGQELGRYSSLLKIDSAGNQLWYKEYYYEDCASCFNLIWDFEETSDGGFIMVGEYYNWDSLPTQQSWMIKVDACGDVEWQGCDFVGIQESKEQQYKIYPNPTNDYIVIEGEYTYQTTVIVYDLLGNMVVNQLLSHTGKVDLTGLSKGIYSLVFEDEGERSFIGKVVLE